MPDEIYLTPEQDESLEAAWEKLSARWHGQKPRLLPRIALRRDGELVSGDGNGGDGEVPFADQPGVLEALQDYARRQRPLPLAGDTVTFAARRMRVSLPKPYEEGKHPRGYHGRWRDANAAHQQAEEVLKAHEKALAKSAEKIDKLKERHEEAKAAHDVAKAKASAAGSSRAAWETHQAHLAAIKAKGQWETAKAAHAALRKVHAAAKKEHTATARELKAAEKEKTSAKKETKAARKPTLGAQRAAPRKPAAVLEGDPGPAAAPEIRAKGLERGMTNAALLKLLGMPEGAELAERGDVEAIPEMPGAYGFAVFPEHPQIDFCYRTIGVDQEGNLFIHNDSLEIDKKFAGQGLGTQIFSGQVAECARQGFAYIATTAAGSQGREYNGYYTWPRLGYDMDLVAFAEKAPQVANKIRRRFPGAQSILDVLASPGGGGKGGWWEQHGVSLPDARFDLAEGSRSRQVLDAYVAERRAGGR